jgi:hypothetical protein
MHLSCSNSLFRIETATVRSSRVRGEMLDIAGVCGRVLDVLGMDFNRAG